MKDLIFFRNKKGFTLIEAMLAIVIFVFPIFATISTVTFLYTQTRNRNLELLAENLSNYILEDLRGRKFYYYEGDVGVTRWNNLQRLYEELPQSQNGIPDPYGSIGDRIMKYSCINDYLNDTAVHPYDGTHEYYLSRYIDLISNDTTKFYNIFKVEIYITRFINANVNEPVVNIDPYKFIYKIDIILLIEDPKSSYTNLKGTVYGWKKFMVASTEVTYHDP